MLGLSLAISEIFARSPKVRERAERVRRSSRMRRSSPLRRCSARERVTARVLLDCNALRICASEGSSADTGPEHANKDKPSIACANPALQTPLRLVMGLFLAETLFNDNLRPIAVAVQVVLSLRSPTSAAFWAAFETRSRLQCHVAVGTRVSSRAPRTEPYVRLSRIRLPPRVQTA